MHPQNQETIYLHLCETYKETPFYKTVNKEKVLDTDGEHYEYLFTRYKFNQGINNEK